jgi:peptidoglycan/LPS O-acetylase OafA/YrhL
MEIKEPVSRPQYRPELDGIRGIAILSVLLSHWVVGFPGVDNSPASKLIWFAITPGWAGVDLFFVLSVS